MSKGDFLSFERDMYIRILRDVLSALNRKIGSHRLVNILDLEENGKGNPYLILIGRDEDGDELSFTMSMSIESKFDVLLVYMDTVDGRTRTSKFKMSKRGLTVSKIASDFENFFYEMLEE